MKLEYDMIPNLITKMNVEFMLTRKKWLEQCAFTNFGISTEAAICLLVVSEKFEPMGFFIPEKTIIIYILNF
jgi:hypothetical protein